MNRLQFNTSENLNGAQVLMPCVDGRPLADMAFEFEQASGFANKAGGYGGLIPEWFRYGPLLPYFTGRAANPAIDDPARIYLLGCECGEVGCWPLVAMVEADERVIRWTQFEQPYCPERDYSAFGPFDFERAQYEAAVLSLPSFG